MSAIIAKVGNAGAERLIDWTVFASGASSLAIALTLTILSILSPAPDFADNASTLPASETAELL